MNRNTKAFGENPTSIDIPRSKLNIPHTHKTTMNTGELTPLGRWEVLPGDTAKIDMASLIRMTTPIYPVMDNSYFDVYFFYVPNRLVWEHWKEFMGENTSSYWTQTVDYTIPQTTAPVGGWTKGSIADKFGLPIGVDGISVDSMPFRAFSLIYNEWFRDENLVEPCDVTKGDATTTGSNGTNPVIDVQKGGMPPKVARLADYFSTALPAPQKGPDVFIPMGTSAPVRTGATDTYITGNGLHLATEDGFALTNGKLYAPYINGNGTSTGTLYTNRNAAQDTPSGAWTQLEPTNLFADLSVASAATINQLRQAFAIQRMYEKDARGGTRYTELIRSHFSVVSPDARQQRPEYLGGKRIPINVTQITQTSSTDSTSPMGTNAAYSLTIDNDGMFTKSFTEHGNIIAVGCIRTDRSYQQGIGREWSRKNREDFYFPTLANLGEQYIKNKEIYAQGNAEDEEAFGYQEAWAEYRYKPNMITGELRSTYTTPLDAWHYGDKYESLPVLGRTWIEEGTENVGRTLAVETQDQFICDFYFNTVWTRPMPIYSIPGLIDHH